MSIRKQTSLTDFFSARKRSAADVKKLVESEGVVPAKRRKKQEEAATTPNPPKPLPERALTTRKATRPPPSNRPTPPGTPKPTAKEVIPQITKTLVSPPRSEVTLKPTLNEVTTQINTTPTIKQQVTPRTTKPTTSQSKSEVATKPSIAISTPTNNTTRVVLSHLQPSIVLPLPTKYRFLAEVFRTVDHICSLKYNRKEVLRVTDLKSSVQTALGKNFEQAHLEQIRTVFCQAFEYIWEPVLSRFGTKKSDYELQMLPNMSYEEDLKNGPMQHSAGPAKDTIKDFVPLTPKSLLERGQFFKNLLLNTAILHHSEYLRSKYGLDVEKVTAWAKGFDEHCPAIKPTPLPEKPNVVKLTTAHEVLEATKTLFGSREKEDAAASASQATSKSGENAPQDRPAIRKELQGLPPALLAKILAKEKEKKLKELMEKDPRVEEGKLLQELLSVEVLTGIVNCHRSEVARQRRGALELQSFVKFVADSNGKKSNGDIEALLRHLAKVTPEFVEIFQINKQEYIKKKAANLSTHALREHLQKLIQKKE